MRVQPKSWRVFEHRAVVVAVSRRSRAVGVGGPAFAYVQDVYESKRLAFWCDFCLSRLCG